MRVTTGMAVGTLRTNLNRSYERIVRFQNELSSGTRINKLSDDPAGVERSLALRSELRNIEQFQNNIDDGVGWLELSEATLNELGTLFVKVRGLAVQGATSTYNGTQRRALADEVDQVLEHAVGLSEARYRGRYIFSGTQAEMPYRPQRNGEGQVAAVARLGDTSGSIEREVNDGFRIQINVPGSEVFENPRHIRLPLDRLGARLEVDDRARFDQILDKGSQLEAGVDRHRDIDIDAVNASLDGKQDPPLSIELRDALMQTREAFEDQQTNPFGVLIELRDALRENKVEDVRGTLGKLASVGERISSVRGLIGARVNRMEITQNVLDRVAVEMTSILSEDEDVDLSSTIVNLRQEQDVFQAALASGTSIIPQSLMDFI